MAGTNGTSPFSNHELEMLRWSSDVDNAAKAMSWASLVLILFPISTVIFPEKRRFPSRQPLCVCVAVLGLTVAFLVGLYRRESLCGLQAIGITLFGNATVAWWVNISYSAYLVVGRGLPLAAARKSEPFAFAFGVGFPVVLTIVAVSLGALDSEPPLMRWECWISSRKSTDQWLYFYGLMGASCLLGLFWLWPSVAAKAWRAGGVHMRHLLFMTLFLVVFTVDFTYRVVSDYSFAGYTLTMTRTVVTCGVGIWTWLIFGATRRNAELWAGLVMDGDLRGGRFTARKRQQRERREGSPLLHPSRGAAPQYVA